MPHAIAIALLGLVGALALMSLVWVVGLLRRDVSIVDVFWGLGFVLVSWIYYVDAGPGGGPRRLLVPALVTLWGLRLALHIAWRSRGRGEDPRYAAMRARDPERFPWRSLVTVFWLQAAILWIVAMPLLQVQIQPRPLALGALDALGLSLFAIGFLFESLGDWQLARFKADPANRGRVMDRGLWRYTRHPNYFGDATLWWGLALLALATDGGWWVLLSPLLMTGLLLKVSGVTLLEKGLSETKPGYADYVRRTSAFLPLPSRK